MTQPVKENQQPITRCGSGDIASYVFLCGDPARVGRISESWSELREVCRVREYVIHTGESEGVQMTAASTGIGGPSTAIAVEELAKLGAHTFIRVGNSGGLQEHIELGDFVISCASVRDEGTSKSYVCPEYPAAAHYEVTAALVAAAKGSGHAWHAGCTWSVDAFYSRNKVVDGVGGMQSMSMGGYQQAGMNERVSNMQAAKVLNVEMESSTLFTLASLFGLRAGCICTVSDRTPWPGPGLDSLSLDHNIRGAIEVARQAMLALAAEDARTARA